jgi:hypothetical protein
MLTMLNRIVCPMLNDETNSNTRKEVPVGVWYTTPEENPQARGIFPPDSPFGNVSQFARQDLIPAN